MSDTEQARTAHQGEGLSEAERVMLGDGHRHTTEALCWMPSCAGSLPWVVERILADRLAASEAERQAEEDRANANVTLVHAARAEVEALRERVEATDLASIVGAHQRKLDPAGSCTCSGWPTDPRDVPWTDHLAGALRAALDAER